MIEHKGEIIKTMAYMPLHYGSDYLEAAMLSVLPAVDEFVILYTPRPTYGHNATMDLPASESKANLAKIVQAVRDKVKGQRKIITWVDISHTQGEGKHRDIGNRYATNKSYEVAVALDSDEIWDTESLLDCIVEAYRGSHRNYLTNHQGWFHFYKSFKEYCQDGFQPVRLFNFNNYNNTTGSVQSNKIYHMGYAIKDDVMAYKLSCHGHKDEIDHTFFDRWKRYIRAAWHGYVDSDRFSQDKDWTLHPASKQVWLKASLFDQNELPQLLKDHRYYGVDKIK